MRYGLAAAAYEGPRPRQRVHEFDIDYLLDCVVRLREIIVRYEFLTAHLCAQPGGLPAYEFGGPEALPRYMRRMEAALMEEAIARADGNLTLAAKLVGSPYLNQFQRALRRVGCTAHDLGFRGRAARVLARATAP